MGNEEEIKRLILSTKHDFFRKDGMVVVNDLDWRVSSSDLYTFNVYQCKVAVLYDEKHMGMIHIPPLHDLRPRMEEMLKTLQEGTVRSCVVCNSMNHITRYEAFCSERSLPYQIICKETDIKDVMASPKKGEVYCLWRKAMREGLEQVRL